MEQLFSLLHRKHPRSSRAIKVGKYKTIRLEFDATSRKGIKKLVLSYSRAIKVRKDEAIRLGLDATSRKGIKKIALSYSRAIKERKYKIIRLGLDATSRCLKNCSYAIIALSKC